MQANEGQEVGHLALLENFNEFFILNLENPFEIFLDNLENEIEVPVDPPPPRPITPSWKLTPPNSPE